MTVRTKKCRKIEIKTFPYFAIYINTRVCLKYLGNNCRLLKQNELLTAFQSLSKALSKDLTDIEEFSKIVIERIDKYRPIYETRQASYVTNYF